MYQAEVKIYTTPWCPYCIRAKQLLKRKKVDFEDINVAYDNATRAKLVEITGRTSVPQIFINGKGIGGSDELHELESKGKLDQLLSEKG